MRDGRTAKAFTKWFSGKFPKHSQPLAQMYSCLRELFLRKVGEMIVLFRISQE
jgi:hypothetical protein